MAPRPYDQAIHAVRVDLGGVVSHDTLRRLHRRSGPRHALLATVVFAALAGAGWTAFVAGDLPGLWIPASLLVGFLVFALTTLLHEVVHGLVSARRRPRLRTALAWLYAVPSGLSASQFSRWHLDHHRWLGDAGGDPKRAHLSPKRNLRRVKALYATAALFPIYFRAARAAAASYEPALRRRIGIERLASTAFHLLAVTALVLAGGWSAALRVHLLPVFVVFPVAFTLNRLGQHYDVVPGDALRWGTLLRQSPYTWGLLFLWSNYHLEHHLYPGVPCYRLPALRRALAPCLAARGVPARSYAGLLVDWFVRNRPPHTDWARAARPTPVAGPAPTLPG
jgi:fatty acid desaturase